MLFCTVCVGNGVSIGRFLFDGYGLFVQYRLNTGYKDVVFIITFMLLILSQRYGCPPMSRSQVLDFTSNLEIPRIWTYATAFSARYYKEEFANAPVRPYYSSARAR